MTMSPRDRLLKKAAEQDGLKGPSPQGEYLICCPYCPRITGDTDTKFKCQLNPRKGVFHCWKCNTGGRANLSWLEERVEVQAGEEPPPLDLGPPEDFIPFPTHPERAPLSVQPFVEYLKKRKVPMSKLNNPLHTGVCLKGRYANRIIIPDIYVDTHTNLVHNDKRWQGFVARSIYKSMQPKYLYPAGMKKGQLLWGLHLPHTEDVTYIVEGVFDALALFPFAVATYGKSVTEEQLDKICRLTTDRIVVCFDGDAWEDGQILAMRIALRGPTTARSVTWCKLPPATDPGELGREVEKYVVADNVIVAEGGGEEGP